jgi:hypothetical protein
MSKNDVWKKSDVLRRLLELEPLIGERERSLLCRLLVESAGDDFLFVGDLCFSVDVVKMRYGMWDLLDFFGERGLAFPAPKETVQLLKFCLDNLDKPSCSAVLQQYVGNEHVQNVILGGTDRKIIHHPRPENFPRSVYKKGFVFNRGIQREVHSFDLEQKNFQHLGEALEDRDSRDFLEMVWGDPEVLIAVAQHLGIKVYWSPPRGDIIWSVTFGASTDFLVVQTDNMFYGPNVARMVLRKKRKKV